MRIETLQLKKKIATVDYKEKVNEIQSLANL